MQLTDYHAKYFAHELTKRCPPDSAEKLAGALVDAQVDLNPHQIEAALFAFKSPLSKGAGLLPLAKRGQGFYGRSPIMSNQSTTWTGEENRPELRGRHTANE